MKCLRIRVYGGRFIDVAATAVAGVAERAGFATPDVDRVRTAVDALCADVAAHHFDDPRDADFSLLVREEHARLAVRIEDKGLPYPVDHFGQDPAADSVRFESRGVDGNVVELIFHGRAEHQEHLRGSKDPGTAPVDPDAPITVRELRPEDTPSLARCVYRCYGYTYGTDFVYYPDQVQDLVDRGLLRSFVGLNPDDEVVAHSGLVRERPDSKVAESGLAVVDPRYRRHHLLETLLARRAEALRGMDLAGYYADAVAMHPATQKCNEASGGQVTGLLLGEVPAFTVFRGFESEPTQRGSVVVYYHTLGDGLERAISLPQRYESVLRDIYGRLRLPRTFDLAVPPNEGRESVVHVDVRKRRGQARVQVEAAGSDLVEAVGRRLRELCNHRLDVVHLDLPMADATAMARVDELCDLGFFFGALFPELRDGDVLRLQYLNELELDPGRLVLVSEVAKRLLAETLSDS